MEDLQAFLLAPVKIMQVPFTLWGFTLSFWEIFIYSLLFVTILALVLRYFND